MTATLARVPDPLTILKRAERKHTSEEPGDMTHLAEAVRTQIVEPLLAATGRPGDADELARLAEESAARGRLLDERTAEIAELTKQLEQARRAGTAGVERLTRERDEARAERDTARAQLRDQVAVDVDKTIASLRADLAERDARLTSIQNVHAAKVAGLEKQLHATKRDLALANRTLDEIADEEAARPAAAPHRHRFELDLKTGEHADCDCGQPWIRDLVEDEEPVTPDVEPLTELLGRIRTEIAEAGWTA